MINGRDMCGILHLALHIPPVILFRLSLTLLIFFLINAVTKPSVKIGRVSKNHKDVDLDLGNYKNMYVDQS